MVSWPEHTFQHPIYRPQNDPSFCQDRTTHRLRTEHWKKGPSRPSQPERTAQARGFSAATHSTFHPGPELWIPCNPQMNATGPNLSWNDTPRSRRPVPELPMLPVGYSISECPPQEQPSLVRVAQLMEQNVEGRPIYCGHQTSISLFIAKLPVSSPDAS